MSITKQRPLSAAHYGSLSRPERLPIGLFLVLLLMASLALQVPAGYAMTQVATLILNPGEEVTSAVIDSTGGFLYLTTVIVMGLISNASELPGTIVKIRLSDFTRVGTLSLNSDETLLNVAAIDLAGGFAYFGTSTSPGKIVKVRLSDFTSVGGVSLKAGENGLSSAVIDTANGFAYFGTSTSPGIIVRIRLTDLARVDALTLGQSEGSLNSAVIDVSSGFAYFGASTLPGKIVKVRLSDFTYMGALTLSQEEGAPSSAVIDTVNGFAYFGTSATRAVIVKLSLRNFGRVGSLRLNYTETQVGASLIDTDNGFAYFATARDARNIHKISLGDFTSVESLAVYAPQGLLTAGAIDTARGFAYFSTFGKPTEPGEVVKVDLKGSPAPLATNSTPMTTILSGPTLLAVLVGVIAVPSVAFVLIRRRKSRHTMLQQLVTPRGGPNISTGLSELDSLLGGGLPEGYAFLLISPAYNERNLLLERIIKSCIASGRPASYVSADLTRTKSLAERFQKDFHVFCLHTSTAEPGSDNINFISGVENLSDLNISFGKTMQPHAKREEKKVIVLDMLTDVLLYHKLTTTRRWVSDFVSKRKSEGYTVVATLNPFVVREDTKTIMDLFDGVLEISEKSLGDRTRRFVAVRQLYGKRYSEAEIVLNKDKLY